MNQFLKPFLWMFAGIFLMQTSSRAQWCTTKEAWARKNTSRTPMEKTACLADNFYLWDVGQTINIRFLNGSVEHQERVLKIAREWEKYANIKFVQVDAEPSNIRVEFGSQAENYSLIGSDANQEDPALATMKLEWRLFNDSLVLKRMVLHQFGHVLGLFHEHRSPANGIQWNKDTLYAHYAQLGWDSIITERQIFDMYNRQYSNGMSFDGASIMNYPIGKWQTTDGYEKPWNNGLSEGDKFVAGLLYPFKGIRMGAEPRVVVTNFTTMYIKRDTIAKGLLFYPSFNFETAGAPCDVYFSIRVYNRDGYPIIADDGNYNAGGVLTSYKQLRMGPDKKFSVNMHSPEEFALFIPFSQIPKRPENQVIQVVFKAMYSNGKEVKTIFTGSPVTYEMVWDTCLEPDQIIACL